MASLMSGRKPSLWLRLAALAAVMVVIVAVSGCSGGADQTDTSISTEPSSSTSASPAITAVQASTSTGLVGTTVSSATTSSMATAAATATTETQQVPAVSSQSIEYAKSLGGSSHLGEMLYFVVGARVETEREAQVILGDALPYFGDMQPYFVVQRSDNFDGLEPGWWVIIEAYRNEPTDENLAFDERGFADVSVERATVLTADPLPVYEDMVGL